MKKPLLLICFFISFLSFSQTKEIDSLTIQLAFQKADTSKVDTSILLINALYQAGEQGQALKYINQTEKLSNSLNYPKGLSDIFYLKAQIYSENGDYINAINTFKKTRQLFAETKDTLGIARVNSKIGIIEIERGNYKDGLQYALAAIKELESRNLKKELANTYSKLAMAYHKIHAFDKAIEFNIKALETETALNNTSGMLTAYQNLAELYSMRKENRKAIEYYEKVLSLPISKNDSLRGEILPKLASEYLQFKDYDKASAYLLEGLQLNRKLDNKGALLVTLNNLGKLNLDQNKFKLAEIQLLEANQIGKEFPEGFEHLTNFKLLKCLDSINRNYNRAYEWQRHYYELKSKLEIPAPLEKDSFDIEPLTEQDTTANDFEPLESVSSKSEKERFDKLQLIFYALLAALAIVSTFLVLIYLKRNSRLKYTRDLEEKNRKIELQNEAIMEQAKHLEDINKVKDKLFSIVSHDLKDSLTSINGFIDLLKDGSLSRSEFENLIPELSENANNASLLLFNLLNWSKSQMQSLEPNPSLFDVQEVFENKLKLVEQKADSKGINLVDQTLRDFVYADKSMVEIIIQNLITNAVKFTKSGDTITVSNHISNGHAIISVSDTGVGISKENQEKLFKSNSFTTIGTKNEKGTGLGLSICKELVDLNNGKIWVESTPNVGSTFYVQLPKTKPANGNSNQDR